MNNPYQEYLKKLKNFNRWEEKYLKMLSPEEKLDRFIQLFLLGLHYSTELQERLHQEHLESIMIPSALLSKKARKK